MRKILNKIEEVIINLVYKNQFVILLLVSTIALILAIILIVLFLNFCSYINLTAY